MSVDARKRRQQARIYLFLNALLLVAIALMINYLAYRHYDRWDWTEGSIYTLSERTERVLEGLEERVAIVVLMSEGEPEQVEVRNLLERYEAASDRLDIRFVDPHGDPDAYDEVVRRYNLPIMPSESQEGVVALTDVAVLVAKGERHWEIGREDLLSRSFDEGGEEIQLNVEAERAITGAIVEVVHSEPTRVCFTTDMGEAPLDHGALTLGALTAELRRENVEAEPLSLREVREVPAHCHAVAVVGPQVPYEEESVAKLRAYVRGGGNLLLALDALPNRAERRIADTGFEDMLRDFGVRLGRDLVVEPDRDRLPPGQGDEIFLYFVTDFGDHATTASLAGLPEPLRRVAVSAARTVTPASDRASVLLRTSERSYAVTDLGALLEEGAGELAPEGERGPQPLGVAVRVETDGAPQDEEEEEPAGGRVIVLGDASLLMSEFLQAPANASLAMAMIGWLTERDALIAIDPRTMQQPGIPSQEDLWPNLFIRVVVLIPLAFVFLGIAVWWNRRQ